MIESEATTTISTAELRRASLWIGRWRRLGGMFGITEEEGTLVLNFIRTWDPEAAGILRGHRKAEQILQGLFNRPHLRAIVETLAVDAWQRAVVAAGKVTVH